MESKNVNSLVRYFIEKEYFNLIGENNAGLDLSAGPVSLIKDFQGTSVLLEIIDGDRYTPGQMAQSIENGGVMLENVNGTNASIFKLFLFDENPDEEKLNIMEQGQIDMAELRKSMKCIMVDYRSRTAKKLYSVPSFDANIVRTVNRYFKNRLDLRETSPEEIEEIIAKRRQELEIRFSAKKSYLTYSLVAANVLMYLIIKMLSLRSGASYDSYLEPFGAKVNSLILQGQYWRFFTPMFLHADEIHLAVNCYSLFILGTQVERIYGHGRFAAIYFISGILGGIASFAFSINQSVGASGAIFGLLGAMLFFAVKRPALLKSSFGANIVTMVVINLAYGFMNKRIDNFAHMGGLAGGFLTTGFIYSPGEKKPKDKHVKTISIVLILAVTLAGLLYGFNSKVNLIASKLADLETQDNQQNWSGAEKLAEEILEMEPSQKNAKIQVLFTLAKAEINQKKFDEGLTHSNQLTEISPENGHFLLGFIYYNTGEYEKAREEFTQAVKYGNSNSEYIDEIMQDINNKLNIQ